MKRLAPIRNDFTLVVKGWYAYRRLMKGLDRTFMKQQAAGAKND
jgi:hypothetical protein